MDLNNDYVGYGDRFGYAPIRNDGASIVVGQVTAIKEEAVEELRAWSREGIVCFLVELVRVPSGEPVNIWGLKP
jgi:hypothetical protein